MSPQPLTHIDLDNIGDRFADGTWTAQDVAALFVEIQRLKDELDSVREVEVRRLALKPGDVLVFSTDRQLTDAEADAMYHQTRDWFPGHETRFVVGADLTIVEPTGGAS